MNLQRKQIILDKIREYDRIFLFRHIRLDGDCVGATKGFQALLRLNFPKKDIRIVDSQKSEFLAFLGPDEDNVTEEECQEALAIILDSGTTTRISNPKYALCKELIKIDHHIPIDNYGNYAWVEEERSSCCEMIADFYATFRDQLQINSEVATFLYTGMVTDSGRFRYRDVSGNTMRLAGMLLDQGVDTDKVYANLYLEDFEHLKFKAHVIDAMHITENGVAWLYVDKAMQERFGLNLESASAAISYMDSIRGCLCWIAFIDTQDTEGSIRVRLRSRFVPVNSVGEHFRGGGHACACGATVYNQEEMDALLAEADALIKDYKETHEDWL